MPSSMFIIRYIKRIIVCTILLIKSSIPVKISSIKCIFVSSIYIRCPCHASLWHSVVTWIRNISVRENNGFDTIMCDYFYRSPFPTPHIYGC